MGRWNNLIVWSDVYSQCVQCVTIHSICWWVKSMCAVCHNPQYMLMTTVNVCSVSQSTVYADEYSQCVQCVTIQSICWWVQSMCAVCHNPQYMLMSTVNVCSMSQSTLYADEYSQCVQCVTIHSICCWVQSMCAVYQIHSICWCAFCPVPNHEMPPKHCQFRVIQKVTIMYWTNGVVRLEGDRCHLMLDSGNKLTVIHSWY